MISVLRFRTGWAHICMDRGNLTDERFRDPRSISRIVT